MTSLDVAFTGITMQKRKDKKNSKGKKNKKNDFIPEDKIRTNQSLNSELLQGNSLNESSLSDYYLPFNNNDNIPFSFINNHKFPNDIQQNDI